jgi:palmitoyl-protein thioesterase
MRLSIISDRLCRNDKTVVPPQSAHFTLPSPLAPPCKPTDPMCYLAPVPYSYLPLYSRDYVGLKQIDARGGLRLGVCEGEHMEIDEICWESVVTWLGKGDGRGRHRGGLMVQD